jgi:hypothetical protein
MSMNCPQQAYGTPEATAPLAPVGSPTGHDEGVRAACRTHFRLGTGQHRALAPPVAPPPPDDSKCAE